MLELPRQKLKVRDDVAADWTEVATALHFKGSEIDIIRQSTFNQCREACRVMFAQWLEGGHRCPVTWETLAQAVTDAGFPFLAEQLREALRQ